MDIINLGNRIVNNYIYFHRDQYILIDTGYENGYTGFQRALMKKHIDPNKIAYLFLTHAHDDHAGFLTKLLAEYPRIQVVLSQQSLEGLLQGHNSFKGGCTGRLALQFCRLMAVAGKGEHCFPALEHKHLIRCLVLNAENRAQIKAELGGKIYETPGHTACSISLMLQDGSLFVGDAAMNGLPSLHKITIWAEDKTAYLSSWQKIIQLKPKVIYPGHGPSFSYQSLLKNLHQVERMQLYPLKPGS